MKTFAKVVAVGVGGIVMIKLLPAMLFSALGLAFGLIALAVKLALVAGIAFFIYSIFFKKDEDEEPASDGEIVVEAEIEEDDDDSDD